MRRISKSVTSFLCFTTGTEQMKQLYRLSKNLEFKYNPRFVNKWALNGHQVYNLSPKNTYSTLSSVSTYPTPIYQAHLGTPIWALSAAGRQIWYWFGLHCHPYFGAWRSPSSFFSSLLERLVIQVEVKTEVMLLEVWAVGLHIERHHHEIEQRLVYTQYFLEVDILWTLIADEIIDTKKRALGWSVGHDICELDTEKVYDHVNLCNENGYYY